MKQRRAIIFLIGSLSVLMMGLTVLAHHGSGFYDIQNPMTLTGVITKVELVNPHSFIYIDVKDKGRVENWALEGSPPTVLSRSGMAKENLKIGSEITVIGFAPRTSYPSSYVGTFSGLNQALAYSTGATEHLKTNRILQVGEIRIEGQIRQYGMDPSFIGSR